MDDKILALKDLVLEKQEAFGFQKPDRMRWGTHMTVGVFALPEGDMDYKTLVEKSIEAVERYSDLKKCIEKEFNII